jgi:preprotein translocase subunit SecB
MKDPQQQPGFAFTSVRLVRATYRLAAPPAEGVQGELDIRYADKVQVKKTSVLLRQSVRARVVDPQDPERAYLDLEVEVEGTFVGDVAPNLDPQDFGNNHAPAILFAFTREWVHKLSSAAAPWPPILLPPVNILQLRKQPASKAP